VKTIESPQRYPLSPPHWRLTGTLLWSIPIAVIYLVVQTAATLIAIALSHPGKISSKELQDGVLAAATDGNTLSIVTAVSTAAGCALIAGIIKLKKGSRLRDYLAIQPVPHKTFLKWMALLFILVAVSEAIRVLFGRPIVPPFVSSIYATANPLWTLWITLIVVGPLLEEMFFRGFLFKGIETSVLGPTGATLISAGLWSVIHLQYDLFDILNVFILGLLLGVARARTQSILVPFVMHSTTNLVATVEAAFFTSRYL
jgi:membrane protease YdiL (CAAX protease family)